MTTLFPVCAGLLGTFLALATSAPSAAQSVSRGYAVTADATVRLYVPSGTLRVEAWDRDSVHMTGTLGANASVFGGGARTHVKLGVEAHSMTDGTLPQATLLVRVPRAARVWVKMIDGTMEVAGTRSELEAYLVQGAVSVHDVQGTTTIESIDASLQLTRASGSVRIRGSRGAVVLSDVRATVSVTTVSGPVTIQRSYVDGRVETIEGKVDVRVPVPVNAHGTGILEVQTHGGPVSLSLPRQNTPARVLSSHSGHVRDNAPRGDARFGQLVVRSFRGDVIVVSASSR